MRAQLNFVGLMPEDERSLYDKVGQFVDIPVVPREDDELAFPVDGEDRSFFVRTVVHHPFGYAEDVVHKGYTLYVVLADKPRRHLG